MAKWGVTGDFDKIGFNEGGGGAKIQIGMGYKQLAAEKLKNNFSNEWLCGERSQKGKMAERTRGIKKYILVVMRFSFIEVQPEMQRKKKLFWQNFAFNFLFKIFFKIFFA